jgi:hypothetical protein
MVSSSSWPCYDFLSPPVASENRLPIENRPAQMRLDFADQTKVFMSSAVRMKPAPSKLPTCKVCLTVGIGKYRCPLDGID